MTFPSVAKLATASMMLAACVNAVIRNIEVPSEVPAGSPVEVTFTGADTEEYRVYLAAAITGDNGPTCYLQNRTTLSSPLTIRIPPSVGPPADYYSIGFAPVGDSVAVNSDIAYSSQFNLTNSTGVPTAYEKALNGAPFWSPESLPCSSYQCARKCAQKFYPDDLTEDDAYDSMRDCILECDGVRKADVETGPTGPVLATTAAATGASETGTAAASTSTDAAAKHAPTAAAAMAGVAGLAALLL